MDSRDLVRVLEQMSCQEIVQFLQEGGMKPVQEKALELLLDQESPTTEQLCMVFWNSSDSYKVARSWQQLRDVGSSETLAKLLVRAPAQLLQSVAEEFFASDPVEDDLEFVVEHLTIRMQGLQQQQMVEGRALNGILDGTRRRQNYRKGRERKSSGKG